MSIVVEAALIGVLVGIVIGSLGGGGGIVAVPVLVYVLGQTPHNAAASSLVVVGTSSLVSLLPHARRGNVDWRMGAVFAAASVLGNLGGARTSGLVDGRLLMALFAVLLAGMAALMIHRAVAAFRRARAVRDGKGSGGSRSAPPWDARRILVVVLTATGVGALTGFFGVGGGFAVVPALLVALYLPMRAAVGTSLVVLTISSLVGLLGRIGTDISPNWTLTFAFAATSIVGALVGARLTRSVRPEMLTAAFAGLMTCVAVFTAIMAFPQLLA